VAPGLAPWPASTDRRGCLNRLLGLVRKLIDYGKELATGLQTGCLSADSAVAAGRFGTLDVALILSRITIALHRAEALEARLERSAARPDPQPRPPRAPPQRTPRAIRRDAQPVAGADARLARLPTPEQIAAEIRSRPVGAVIADICRDLGIRTDHPLWRDIQMAIILHGGSLARFIDDIFERARCFRSECGDAPPAASRLSPIPPGTGPP